MIGRRSAARRRAGGPVAQGRRSLSVAGLARLRAMVFAREDYRCGFCGVRASGLELEHATNRSQGGADAWDSTWAACPACNRRKLWPYVQGRLVVQVLGGGRFRGAIIVAGSKVEAVERVVQDQVPWHAWGRLPTPEEASVLAGLAY